MTKYKTIFIRQSLWLLMTVVLISNSYAAIFSSIIRNNLNRYLKNPLFTKSFVRNSAWQGEYDDLGSSSALYSSPNAHINEFIKSQNKFTNDHVLEPYGNYNFDLMQLNNDYGSIISRHKPMVPSSSPSTSNTNKPSPDVNFKHKPTTYNKTTISNSNDRRDRFNSKSLTVTASNVNAYSDSSLLNSYNKNIYSDKNVNRTNLFPEVSQKQNIADKVALESRDSPKFENSLAMSISEPTRANINFENRLQSVNKYNQEKALNLKLEYGFKPLPPSVSSSGNFKKDFSGVTNSINFDDSDNYSNFDERDNLDSVNSYSNNNDDDSLDRDKHLSLKTDTNRTMKALSPVAEQNSRSNHLEEYATDYKKYISYPMETESSDIHKLAFTGMESFKPDHGYGDSTASYHLMNRLVDTVSNYPNIDNFETQGVDCARNSGYCEYDSSYPKDYVNDIIANCTFTIDDMYIEMPENLADFDGYKSFIQVGQLRSHQTNNMSLCDSERKYIRPSVSQDVNGKFYLILQSSFYFQQVPVEICSKEGSSCNIVGQCNSQVKCTQKYRTHMLISVERDTNKAFDERNSWDRPRNCPKMRMYRLPSSCICELSKD